MENEILNCHTHQSFILQQKRAFKQLIQTLTSLLIIDKDLWPYFPSVQEPYIPQFWKLVTKFQKTIKGCQKTDIVSKLSILFYKINQSQPLQQRPISMQIIVNQIQQQFQKTLLRVAIKPTIIKKCQLIINLNKLIFQTHNLLLLFDQLKSIQQTNTIFSDKQDLSNKVFLWKIKSCQIIISQATNKRVYFKSRYTVHATGRSSVHTSHRNLKKSHINLEISLNNKKINNNHTTNNKQNQNEIANKEFLKYLKKTKKYLTDGIISFNNALKVYKVLLYYLIKFQDQSLVYLQLQIINLKKRFKMDEKSQKYFQILLSKSISITKQKVNLMVQQTWGNKLNNETEKELRKNKRRSSIRQKFLQQTSQIIFKFDPTVRQRIQQKRRNQHSTVHNKIDSNIARKRVGFITNRNSIANRVKTDVKKNESVFSTGSFKAHYRKNIYDAIGQVIIKESVVTNTDLINQMMQLKDKVLQYPRITDDQLMLRTNHRKMDKTKSLKFKGRPNNMQNCVLGDTVLKYYQFFGKQLYCIELYQQQRVQDKNAGIGFKIDSQYSPLHIIKFQNDKKLVSYEQLKKLINNSQLYFQLIQERVQQPIQLNETQLFSELFVNIAGKAIDKNETNLLISVIRMMRHYFYWYYTQISKINGTILGRRPNTKITDSLKFSIALEFLRKNTLITCLNQFSNVRNKIGLIQCFQYLSTGRQILVKTFVRHHLQIYFCTFVIDLNSYRSFVINPKRKAYPYFKKIIIKTNYYKPQKWQIENQQVFDHESYFQKNQITLILLSNIIQKYLPKKKVKQILKTTLNQQAEFLVQLDKKKDYQIQLQQDQQEDQHNFIKTNRNKTLSITMNNQLIHFQSLMKIFSEVYSLSFNFSLIKKKKQFIKLMNRHFQKTLYIFGGKTILITFQDTSLYGTKYVFKSSFDEFDQNNQFCLIQTPYYHKIGIKIKQDKYKNGYYDSQFIRINSIKKNVKQQFTKNHIRAIYKTLIRGYNNKNKNKKYFYISISENIYFQYFRLDCYCPQSQKKYFCIFDIRKMMQICQNQKKEWYKNQINSIIHSVKLINNKINTRKSEQIILNKMKIKQLISKQRQIWKDVINRQSFEINMNENYIKFNESVKLILFESFGSLQDIGIKDKSNNIKNNCYQGGGIQLIQIESLNKIYYLVYDYNKKNKNQYEQQKQKEDYINQEYIYQQDQIKRHSIYNKYSNTNNANENSEQFLISYPQFSCSLQSLSISSKININTNTNIIHSLKNNCSRQLLIGQPDQNPFSYNTNIFAQHICKQFKVNLYSDLFVRMYLKYLNSQLVMDTIHVNQLCDIAYHN